jgi:hypothetical protein
MIQRICGRWSSAGRRRRQGDQAVRFGTSYATEAQYQQISNALRFDYQSERLEPVVS